MFCGLPINGAAIIIIVSVLSGLCIKLGAALTGYAYADACTTPDGKHGQCMPILSCKDIEKRLLDINSGASESTPEFKQYMVSANCGEVNSIRLICCAQAQIQHHSKAMALFTDAKFDCGSQVSRRVANGYEVQLSSRPWMALLRYNYDGSSRFLCGGTLISERYVLTAAHCVHGLEDELFEVRLGEHKISTDTDCVRHGKRLKCAPPAEDVGIEKRLLHQYYDPKHVTNDIALLRLNRSISIQKHISPICLPITDQLKQEAEKIEHFLVTGWGTTENGSSSDVLLQASVPQKPRSVCQQAFRRIVDKDSLCVGGGDLQDSCKGDSGGPLQALAKYLDEFKVRMVEFGIVSLGVTSCGQISLPGLYTNVAEYVQWITDTMVLYGL